VKQSTKGRYKPSMLDPKLLGEVLEVMKSLVEEGMTMLKFS